MKSYKIILMILLSCNIMYAQQYTSKINRIAQKIDAFPYGEAKVADIDIILDLDNQLLKLSNFPDYCFNIQIESEKPYNNGKMIRLSSECPEHKRCYIMVYIEKEQITMLEVKFTQSYYKYSIASL